MFASSLFRRSSAVLAGAVLLAPAGGRDARAMLAGLADSQACIACHQVPAGGGHPLQEADQPERIAAGIDQVVQGQLEQQRAVALQRLGALQSHDDRLVAMGVLARPGDEATGATLEPVDDSLRAQLDLPKGQGLSVTAVTPGGPAAAAGIEQNDILLSLADKPLADPADLTKRLKEAGEKPAPLKLLRAGKPMTLEIRPVYRVTLDVAHKPEDRSYYIGVPIRPVDDAMRGHLGLPADQGLVATEIVPNSPAAKAGLKPHDILLAVGDAPLNSTEALVAQVQKSEGKPIDLKILRGGKEQTIRVTPERRPAPPRATAADAYRNWTYAWPANPHMQGYVATGPAGPGHPVPLHPPTLWSAAGDASGVERRLAELTKEVQALRKEIADLKGFTKDIGAKH